jgi:uncharacterized protein YbaR (Trm112 family)
VGSERAHLQEHLQENNMSEAIAGGGLFGFDVKAVTGIACPACHGDLRVDSAWLECAGCGRRYPIVDGIPVLIAERAEGGDAAK